MPRKEQMVIHEDWEYADLATNVIKRVIGKNSKVTRDYNFERAMELLEDRERQWSLIVVSATAPASPSTRPIAGNCDAACDFIRKLRRDVEIPIVVLSAPGNTRLKDLLENWNFTALVEDPTALEAGIRSLRYGTRPEPLELMLTFADKGNSKYFLRRKGIPYFECGGDLLTDPDQVQAFLDISRTLGGNPEGKWLEWMERASKQLNRMLFNWENEKLTEDFLPKLMEVGVENLRVSFTMTPSWHDAMVEALRRGSNPKDYWMLKAPIVRQYSADNESTVLFGDIRRRKQDVNCLIINADPQRGQIENGPCEGIYRPLPSISDEADRIQKILEDAKGSGVGIVERLDLSKYSVNLEKRILDALEREQWHIVHFAGHGVVGTDSKAWLVLSARLAVAMQFGTLARKLNGTEFLFVSACRTASQAFMTKSIQESIPVVLGYQWPVEDAGAADFAKSFYGYLFAKDEETTKSLERSLLASRQAAFDRSADKNTWASPVLLTQISNQSAA